MQSLYKRREVSIDCKVITSQRGTALVSELVSMIKKKKVCTDCQNYTIMQSLKKSIPKIMHSVEPFSNSRIIKDEKEISILKSASKIIDQMFEICTKKIKKGLREYFKPSFCDSLTIS